MIRNTTLLLKMFEIGKKGKPLSHCILPLFEIKVYSVNMRSPLTKITANPRLTYSPRNKIFDRVLVIHSNQSSNARRNVFINKKRNDLIHFINTEGKPNHLYTLQLHQINEFVPTEHLIEQLRIVLKNKLRKNNSSLNSNQRFEDNRIAHLKNEILLPFNLQKWEHILSIEFPKRSNLSHHLLNQSYLSLQICSIYVIEFGLNSDYMYSDLKDFDSFLGKFNFIRYFWQVSQFNSFIAQKYSERLIKSIKWKSKQTEKYLLLLMRSQNWEKFLICVQDYCITFEHLYPERVDWNRWKSRLKQAQSGIKIDDQT